MVHLTIRNWVNRTCSERYSTNSTLHHSLPLFLFRMTSTYLFEFPSPRELPSFTIQPQWEWRMMIGLGEVVTSHHSLSLTFFLFNSPFLFFLYCSLTVSQRIQDSWETQEKVLDTSVQIFIPERCPLEMRPCSLEARDDEAWWRDADLPHTWNKNRNERQNNILWWRNTRCCAALSLSLFLSLFTHSGASLFCFRIKLLTRAHK